MKTLKTLLVVVVMLSFSPVAAPPVHAEIPYPTDLPENFKQAPVQIRCEVQGGPTKFMGYKWINLEKHWEVLLLGRDNKALYLFFSDGWVWERQNNDWIFRKNLKVFAAREGAYWEKIFDIPKAAPEEILKRDDFMNFFFAFSEEEDKYINECFKEEFKKWQESQKAK